MKSWQRLNITISLQNCQFHKSRNLAFERKRLLDEARLKDQLMKNVIGSIMSVDGKKILFGEAAKKKVNHSDKYSSGESLVLSV